MYESENGIAGAIGYNEEPCLLHTRRCDPDGRNIVSGLTQAFESDMKFWMPFLYLVFCACGTEKKAPLVAIVWVSTDFDFCRV